MSESDWRNAEALLHDYSRWIDAEVGADLTYEQPEFGHELSDLADVYRSADRTLLVADDGSTLCGVVAVRIHSDGSAELKRLYVRPASRGAGWADRLVTEAIREASRRGANRIWLETLPGPMDPAIALYRYHGFDVASAQPTIAVDGVIVMERDLHA